MTKLRWKAETCEIDHVRPWNHGGTTAADNLTALCPPDHRAKSRGEFTVSRDPTTGQTIWASPTGQTYRRAPDGTVVHSAPDPPPDPASRATGPPPY